MLTEEQFKLVTRLVDLNSEADNTSNSYAERDNFILQAQQVRKQLRNSMGEEAYMEFMRKGMEMFASN